MSNSFNPIPQGKTEGDAAKRILRSQNEVVRFLDDVRGCAQFVQDLFQPAVEVLRSKLHELSYRLIFVDPTNARRGEDILWKKGYHDVFSSCKTLKKENWTEREVSLIRGLLLSGIGRYQHLIHRLQNDYSLSVVDNLDIPLSVRDYGLPKGQETSARLEEATWADAMVARCLLYLGDLNRYMKEIDPGWDLGIAERLYLQAICIDPHQGRPYNLLGTLAASRNHSLDAVYYYICSLSCAESFPGALGNLTKIFEKNTNAVELEGVISVHDSPAFRSVSRFLLLVEAWYCGKNPINLQLRISEMVDNLKNLQFGGCQLHLKRVVPPRDWEMPYPQPADPINRLSAVSILHMTSISFMCWSKVGDSGLWLENSILSAFFSLLATILEYLVKMCQLQQRQKKQKRKGKARRRRRRNIDESEESGESSEVEEVECRGLDSDGSGDSPEISSSEDEEIPRVNGHIHSQNNRTDSKGINWFEDEMMAVLGVTCSWLRFTPQAAIHPSSKNFYEALVTILNGLSAYFEGRSKYSLLQTLKSPLYEDVLLRGCPSLREPHSGLNWSLSRKLLTKSEEAAVRGYRILDAAQHIQGVSYDSKLKTYQVTKSECGTPQPTSEECKGLLMKNMGQLWLQAEVRDLESRVRRSGPEYTPYLIVDADALVDHVALIKQLVGSRHFIVVIPTVVLTQLDEFKRESGNARETIRWLESQFQRGNRHLRSQKAQEKRHLGLIKYPKKKEKDKWYFYQMMECCHFLIKQNELKCKEKSGAVTLLTGNIEKLNSLLGPDSSPSGLAATFGVILEHVEVFHSKWKLSSKSHG